MSKEIAEHLAKRLLEMVQSGDVGGFIVTMVRANGDHDIIQGGDFQVDRMICTLDVAKSMLVHDVLRKMDFFIPKGFDS